MRSPAGNLFVTEVKRRLISPRMGLVVTIFLYGIWITTTQMRAYQAQTGLHNNAWDTYIGLFSGTGALLLPAVIFPLALVYLLGGAAQEDILSGFANLIQLRLGGRSQYWAVKVLAQFTVVFLVLVGVWAAALALGAARGLPVLPIGLSEAGGHPDAWTLARGVPPVYYSLPADSSSALHGLVLVGYYTLAYGAITVFAAGLTIRSKNLHAPLLVACMVVAAGLAMSFAASTLVYDLSVTAALVESVHRVLPSSSTPALSATPWSTSTYVMSVFAITGILAGAFLNPLRRNSPSPWRLRRSIARGAATVLLLVGAGALSSGCYAFGDYMPRRIEVPAVGVPDQLSPRELTYVATVAQHVDEIDVALALAGTDLVGTEGRSGQASLVLAADQLAAQLEEATNAIEQLERPSSLDSWYLEQIEPGLAELRYTAQHLSGAVESEDSAGVWTCLDHANVGCQYLAGAGRTISASRKPN